MFLVAAGLVHAAQVRPGHEIRRLPDGRPDLQGTYDISTATPLERSPGQPLELSDEQARKVEQPCTSVERFSRIDDSTLRYQFTVDDPRAWSILRGARFAEQDEFNRAPRP